MQELTPVFETREITKSTQMSHIQTLNKIQKMYTIFKPLYQHSFDECLHILDIDPTLSTSYKRKIISLFIITKDHYNKLDEDLPRLKEFLYELNQINKTESSEKLQHEDTSQFEEIRDWIESIDIDKDPVKYVVNYLVFYINVRNMDLVVKIIDYDHQCLIPTGDTGNYLMYSHFEVKYLRNSYKTKKTYGSKIISITEPKFVDAVSRIKFNTYLLNNNPNTVRQMIKGRLYNNMNETQYLHNVIQQYKGDINKILEIEFNRGSSIRMLLTAYNSDLNPKK